jgi:hypothetical protein
MATFVPLKSQPGRPARWPVKAIGIACRKCGADRWSLRVRPNGERHRQCLECSKATSRNRPREMHRKHKIKSRYGITMPELEALRERQRGLCAICGRALCPTGRDFCVDHNHDTGVVRGLLCFVCNTGLGAFRDRRELLLRALEYLEDGASPASAEAR